MTYILCCYNIIIISSFFGELPQLNKVHPLICLMDLFIYSSSFFLKLAINIFGKMSQRY